MQANLPNPNEIKHKALIMLIILLALLSFGLFGCKSNKVKEYNNTVQKDSIYTSVNYVYRDTTIVIPGDLLRIKVPVYSLTEEPISIKTSSGMTLSLSKINEDILAECNTDDLKKIIQLQDMVIQEYKNKSFVSNKEVNIPVKYIPKYISFLAIIGAIALLIFIYWLYKKLANSR